MYTWLAYREQKHQLRSMDIDRRICISNINHRHLFFCDLLSNISGKFQGSSLSRSSITLFRFCYTFFILKYLSICYFTVTLTHRIWWIAPLIVQKRPKSFSIGFGHEHIIFVLLVAIRGCMFSTRICLKKVIIKINWVVGIFDIYFTLLHWANSSETKYTYFHD